MLDDHWSPCGSASNVISPEDVVRQTLKSDSPRCLFIGYDNCLRGYPRLIAPDFHAVAELRSGVRRLLGEAAESDQRPACFDHEFGSPHCLFQHRGCPFLLVTSPVLQHTDAMPAARLSQSLAAEEGFQQLAALLR